ncbi:DNA/RNA-binding domain of Phe-tRNA-synthetase-like protein [Pseudarthrobacter oxydans]|uniref:DNA/RNA-binding domain of Phe-tRNA-synthetase-like protein n=1 Tax=Pseudarthrobacter oxydans TaxID=1671 RepID=A0AAW8NEI4_PSEOX|nr:phenylalanine--tRNA ligase beta subunit-related protein [Pseudarthrobacter oxydans]MDR7165732.1 DNA/RNA-binding domain of Phe-tRNA-synthetase-like protein [Pseudarthrobacter oxydans]
MLLSYAPDITTTHPTLVTAVIRADRITATADVSSRLPPLEAAARRRLDTGQISEFPEIRAWRHAFSVMGLKPTQYRCAAESLLRRLEKSGNLPSIHPLVDLCNHVSISLAVPIAVFDLTHIASALTVRPAEGSEHYLAFNGETEQPEPGEVIFADNAGEAHARRWTNRQSARSAIRETSSDVLIVAEALHDDAHDSLSMLLTMLTTAIRETWGSHMEGELILEGERQSVPGTPHRLLE